MSNYKAQMKGADRVVTGLVRLSFCYLFEPRQNDDGSQGKYECCLLIKKSDKSTLDCINKATEAAKARGLREKWANKLPKNMILPLHDGDEKSEYEGFEDCYYINAKSTKKPGLVDKNIAPILDREEIYPGCYAIAAISFYPFNKGSNGIGVSIDNIMKVKDGEHLDGGKPAADNDFSGIEIDDDDDDL